MAAAVDAEILALLGTLRAEGHIDSQFEQLLQLQDESDPDFVQSVMDLFFKDSQASLERIHGMLMEPSVDYAALDSVVHQLKGSSASFGAQNVTNLCKDLRHAVQSQQGQEAVQLVTQVGAARQALLERLLAFSHLETQKKQLAAQP